jgi:hypothetical protein
MNRRERRSKSIKRIGEYPCIVIWKGPKGLQSKKFYDIDEAREWAKDQKFDQYILL